jgi:DNA-binding LytR/AlgR family response regulator
VKLSNELLLKAGIVSDNFEINPSHIICIKSDGNYLEFFVKDNDGFKKHLKRMTLQSAIDQLRSELYIVKTHRAFLVNTQHLKNVEGNAQGYQLTLYHLDFKVPVSRTHLNSFNRLVG